MNIRYQSSIKEKALSTGQRQKRKTPSGEFSPSGNRNFFSFAACCRFETTETTHNFLFSITSYSEINMITETVVFSIAAFIGNLGVAITGELRSRQSLNIKLLAMHESNALFAGNIQYSCFPIPFDATILGSHNTHISFH